MIMTVKGMMRIKRNGLIDVYVKSKRDPGEPIRRSIATTRSRFGRFSSYDSSFKVLHSPVCLLLSYMLRLGNNQAVARRNGT